MFARHVGRNIRHARQANGLSKAELADRAGIHWTVLVSYEADSGVPILETFVKIAYALGVSPCALLPGLEWDPMTRKRLRPTPARAGYPQDPARRAAPRLSGR